MLKWIFDPAPASGQEQGRPLLLHSLGLDVGIDVLVRETIQNSYDQITEGNTGSVKFTFIKLDGEEKGRFLESISWDSLEPHLSGKYRPTPVSRRLNTGLEMVNSDEPLILLRIDDSGTNGLSGGEDDQNKNFNQLCRALFNTSESNSNRIGSYGLGKSVLWMFSSLLTVLFSSRLEGNDPQSGLRVFGRSELPSHETQDNRLWRGAGFFGKEVVNGDLGKRANSVWNDDAESIADDAKLFRASQLKTGTTILIIGFYERAHETVRPLPEIASDVLQASERWFWRPIGDKKLEVSVLVIESGKTTYQENTSVGDETGPFKAAIDETKLVEKASAAGDVAEKSISVQIPRRILDLPGSPKHEQIAVEVTLRVRRSSPEDSPSQQNRVALMRSKGMVVDYRPSRAPLDGQPYHAVLLAGTARGDTSEDKKMHDWLRAAEPPTHQEWTHTTDSIGECYSRGTATELRKLFREIDQGIMDLCDELPPETSEGPSRLANLFPIGGPGGNRGGSQIFRVDQEDAKYENSVWDFSARVTRRGSENRPWKFDIALQVKGETGSPSMDDTIEIDSIIPSAGEAQNLGSRWRCVVPAAVPEVTFLGSSVTIESINGVDVNRSTILLGVHPSYEEGE